MSPPSFSWDNLVPDLLIKIIADHLDVTSSVRLSAVCTSWASTICPCLRSLPPYRLVGNQPIPWLLLSPHEDSELAEHISHTPSCTNLTFYDISTRTSYFIPVYPSLRGHDLLGSSKGWLVTVDPTGKFHLIKLLTDANICLPSLPPVRLNHEFPTKVVLCHNSDGINKLPAVAFCLTSEGSLWTTKVGYKTWTYLSLTSYQDVIVYQGKVYATSWNGLYCCDSIVASDECLMYFDYSIHSSSWTTYLLEWNDELFMLQLKRGRRRRHLRDVKLYKAHLKDTERRMSRVTSLGNNALLFSPKCSYIIPAIASDRDPHAIRENCIYFTDRVPPQSCHDPNHSFQVYNLGDQTITPCCPHGSQTRSAWPILFLPS